MMDDDHGAPRGRGPSIGKAASIGNRRIAAASALFHRESANVNRPLEPLTLPAAPHSGASGAVRREPGRREFVALIAGLMALNALAIDSMVPALPQIGRSLHVLTENERQLIVSFYMFGFGTTQDLYGPLSDRYGRKPVLIVSLILN